MGTYTAVAHPPRFGIASRQGLGRTGRLIAAVAMVAGLASAGVATTFAFRDDTVDNRTSFLSPVSTVSASPEARPLQVVSKP